MGPASFLLRLRSGAHELLERARPHRPRHRSQGEARAELALAAAYLVVAGLLLLAGSSRPLPVATAAILVAAYALASRIRLHVGAGYAVPTQLVLVPMFLDLPAPAVPALAAAGYVLAGTVEAACGRRDLECTAAGLAGAWHVVAGSLVVLWAGEPASGSAAVAVVLAALAAQCAADLAGALLRAWLGGRGAPEVQLGAVGVICLIDLLLTPVGLLAAAAGPRDPVALLAILALLALLAAAATERRRRILEAAARLDALQHERARLERALRRVGDAFASKLDRDALVELALQTALEALGADRAIALLPGGRTGCGAPADPAASRALVGAVAAARRARQTRAYAAAGHVAVAHPLDAGHGVLCVSRPGDAFTPDEQELFGHLCRQAVVAIENAELHDRLRRQATEDDLTGLANHRRFQELLADEVARTGRTGQPLSLVMLDVDNFKAINDVHGHQRGDAVLQALGAAVRGVCRSTDEPARYGGEELAVVLPATDVEGAYVLAEELRSAVARLQVLPAGAGPVTVSLGVAALAPGDGPGDLIAAADAALYDAKRSGKNRTVRAQRAAATRRAVPRGPSGRRAPAQGAPEHGPFRGLPGLGAPVERAAPPPAGADRVEAGTPEPGERPLGLPR